MKNSMVAVSVAVAVVCGALLIRENREAAQARLRVAIAEGERQALADRAAEEQNRAQRLQTQLHRAQTDALNNALQSQRLQEQLRKPDVPKGPEPAPGNTLLRDPEMKAALLSQAREAVDKSVKSLFRFGLAQHLRLGEEQSEKLRQLLLERSTLLSEQIYFPMMLGELDEAAMAASGKTTRLAYDANTAQIRELLGDDGFAAYESFEKTQTERENMRRLMPQFEQAGQPLNAEQEGQLLAALTTERLNFKFQYDLGDASQWDFERWYDNFTDEKLTRYGRDMEQLNERMVQRAQRVLTAEQAALLKSFLAERLRQAQFVARSTTAMFGKKR